jgi:glycosyltransferase involved in cell wall biosynthesis
MPLTASDLAMPTRETPEARPTFSVVVPTFNRLPHLQRALDTVWKQTFADYEVIVVDDGSSDGTAEWLATQTDRLRYLLQENKGPGAARNAGAAAARGDYIAFLDSDDLWFPWTLTTYAETITACHSPAILGGAMMSFRDEDELNQLVPQRPSFQYFDDFYSTGGDRHFVGSNMLVAKRKALVDCGGFLNDRMNAEDHDLILRLGTARGFVQLVSPVTIGWRKHAGSETSDDARNTAGVLRLIENERRNRYPGGDANRDRRQRFITQHARPASLSALKAGHTKEAFRLYSNSFAWHFRQGRWKYLVGFPLLALRRIALGR